MRFKRNAYDEISDSALDDWASCRVGGARFAPIQALAAGRGLGSQAAVASWISPGDLTSDVPGHGLRVQDQHVDSVRVAALY